MDTVKLCTRKEVVLFVCSMAMYIYICTHLKISFNICVIIKVEESRGGIQRDINLMKIDHL